MKFIGSILFWLVIVAMFLLPILLGTVDCVFGRGC